MSDPTIVQKQIYRWCGIKKENPKEPHENEYVGCWIPIEFSIHDAVVDYRRENGEWETDWIVFYVRDRRLTAQELRDYGHIYDNIRGVFSPNVENE